MLIWTLRFFSGRDFCLHDHRFLCPKQYRISFVAAYPTPPRRSRGISLRYRPGAFPFRPRNEGARVLETLRKHHQSTDHNFLHRSYTPNFFSATKKNIFFSRSKKKLKKKIEKKSGEKINQIFLGRKIRFSKNFEKKVGKFPKIFVHFAGVKKRIPDRNKCFLTNRRMY